MKSLRCVAFLLIIFCTACKKKKDVTCNMESVVITQDFKTTAYAFEYDDEGRITKATSADGYLLFIYAASTIIINNFEADGDLLKHTEGTLNSEGNFTKTYGNNPIANVKDTSTYTYNADGYLTNVTTRKNGQTATGQLTYTNGNHTQTVFTDYNGNVTTYTYNFTDQPNVTGLYEEFSILLPYVGKPSKNLPESRTTVKAGGTTVEQFAYTLNEHNYVTRLTLLSSSSSVAPFEESIYYTCK